MRVEFRHASADFSVVETTTLCMLFMMSPNGSPAGIGSNASPWVCHVLRPNKKVSAWLTSCTKFAPISSCQNGPVQPPCAKPPSASSSTPPGACITPSNETNSETIIFLMLILLILVISFYQQTH